MKHSVQTHSIVSLQAWSKTSSSTYLRPTIPDDADPAFEKVRNYFTSQSSRTHVLVKSSPPPPPLFPLLLLLLPSSPSSSSPLPLLLLPPQLVQSLWAEDPSERPTFQQVLKELNVLSPQRGDLMDNLIKMVRWLACMANVSVPGPHGMKGHVLLD